MDIFVLIIVLALVFGGLAFHLSTRQDVKDILFQEEKLKITLATGADLSDVEVWSR